MIAPSHIGQYRILRKIGAGGMGTVFLGEHVLLKRRAAIKTLLPSLATHEEIVERFFNEARATSAITDPGVVQIFDFGYHVDGTAYIVMELLEGEALSDRIERLATLPVTDALRIARQVASSLAAAHAHDIIHRDLKPENIYVVADPEAQGGERTKILDFGICKVSDRAADLTQTDTMLGTPVYMSPEQCRGAGRADHRSDLYTLGCVLFHMLSGRPPFQCDGVGEFIAAHLREEPPRLTSLAPQLPEMLDELLARCLAKDPDARFQSMTELQTAIEQALARISESGVAIQAAPRAVLPEGYKSEYAAVDVAVTPAPSGGTPPPPSRTPPELGASLQRRWFATPTPTPFAQRDDADLDVRPRSYRAMVAIVLAAAVATFVVVRMTMVHDDAVAEAPVVAPSAEPEAPEPSGAEPPAKVVERVATPAAGPAAPEAEPEPVAEPVEPAPPTEAEPAPPVAAAVDERPSKRTVRRSSPPPRRAAKPPSPAPSTSAPAATEDLYDTR